MRYSIEARSGYLACLVNGRQTADDMRAPPWEWALYRIRFQ